MKLLNVDANPKTVKGQPHGYMTAVLYLAPYNVAGVQVCPMAEQAGCAAACLNTAGRGGIAKDVMAPYGVEVPDNTIQRARIARTRLFVEDREAFMAQLIDEISRFVRKAERKGLKPAVRLNGTSDIQWEKIETADGYTIFDHFPTVQFYDYTKIYRRFERPLPANYHLSLSYSGANPRYREACLRAHREHNASLIVVVRTKAAKAEHMAISEHLFGADGRVDGDAHDLRFLDPPGSIVYLYAKGAARKDETGFVID